LTWPHRSKSDGAKSGEYRGCGTRFIPFCSIWPVVSLARWGLAWSAPTTDCRLHCPASAERHSDNGYRFWVI
jgi:hypothetical protein